MGGSIAPVPAALLQKQPESPPQQHISNDGLQQVLSEGGLMNAVLEEYVKTQPLATFHFQDSLTCCCCCQVLRADAGVLAARPTSAAAVPADHCEARRNGPPAAVNEEMVEVSRWNPWIGQM